MLWPTRTSAGSSQESAVVIEYVPIGSSLGDAAYFSSLNDSVIFCSHQWSAIQWILVASFSRPFVSRSNTIVPTWFPLVGFVDKFGLFNCFLRWWVRFIQGKLIYRFSQLFWTIICYPISRGFHGIIPWVFVSSVKNPWTG